MNEVLKYKGYIGSIEIDMEEKVLHGKLLFINGLITYEAIEFDTDELTNAFQESVDEYLSDCKELEITPEKTCKGQFNVRIPSELHLKVHLMAMKNNESLNTLVKRALETEVFNKTIKHDITVNHNHSIIMTREISSEYGNQEIEDERPQLRIVK